MIAQATAPLSQQYKKLNQHGEFELVAAVIGQAVTDIEMLKRPPMKPHKRYDGRLLKDHSAEKARRKNGRSALAWVKAMPHRPIKEWSFTWCCEVLGLEPVKLRDKILTNAARAKEVRLRQRARGRQGKAKTKG